MICPDEDKISSLDANHKLHLLFLKVSGSSSRVKGLSVGSRRRWQVYKFVVGKKKLDDKWDSALAPEV